MNYSFFKFIYFIYFYFSLCCVFVAGGERGILFLAVHGLLIVVASLIAEHRL